MDDADAELGGKHLPALRVADEEAGAGSGAVGTQPEFLAEFFEVLFQPGLEQSLVGAIALVPTGIEVSLSEVCQ